MISNQLSIEEEDALKRILRHHGVPLKAQLVKDLSSLINWVHTLEKSKSALGTFKDSPPHMLSFLSSLGIYGGEAISNIHVEEIEESHHE